jgi:hypothetical protein
MSNALAGLPNQLKDAALGNAVPLTQLCGGHPRNVLSYQTFDRVSIKPLADATFSALTTGAPRWASSRSGCHVCQDRRTAGVVAE